MASEKVLELKKKEVKKLAEQMKDAKLILLTNYREINVTDDTILRKDLRNANARYSIIKNNITRRALAECKLEGLDDKLEGPTAVVISSEDYLEPAKIIYKFSKDNEYYEIKGGVVEGKVMSADEIITLAKLPSKETLLSMLAGALLGNISKIAVALNEVKKQKEEAGEKVVETSKVEEKKAEEPVVEEAKVEEAKAEEPVAEEAKVEEAKAEEPVAEEAKVEEAKVEEPVAEEAKVEEAKAEETKAEE